MNEFAGLCHGNRPTYAVTASSLSLVGCESSGGYRQGVFAKGNFFLDKMGTKLVAWCPFNQNGHRSGRFCWAGTVETTKRGLSPFPRYVPVQVFGRYFCFIVDVQVQVKDVRPARAAGGVNVMVWPATSAPTVPTAAIVIVITPVPAVVAPEEYLPVTGAPTPAVMSAAAGYAPFD